MIRISALKASSSLSSNFSDQERSGRRVAVCYCATFLKPEMQHIYRQLNAVNAFRVRVLTRKRENEGLFPFPSVTVIRHDPLRWARRIICRQILRRPLQLTAGEIRRIQRDLQQNGCAVLHIVFGNTAVQLLPLLADPARVLPVVVSFHGADVLVEMDKPAYREATLEVLGRADLVLARSESLVNALLSLGCPAEKIRLNRTGIPLGAFPFQERAWPADGAWRLLQSCRLIAKKGVATTLRAFEIFRRSHPRATLLIAGDGPQEAELRRLSDELGIVDKVEFAGFLAPDELKRRLDEAHIFLHPSELGADGNQEGVPNALLEAMATGLPAFATRHGGIPEVIDHGVSGWLVNEGDHAALGHALRELAAAPGRLSAMAAAGSRAVAEKFELRAQARKLQEYYAEAIEEAWISEPDR
jgi:colanic acid/amylovoran biosynthesis glycosyltransferase